MRILGTQPTRNLFLSEQHAPANQSPENLPGASTQDHDAFNTKKLDDYVVQHIQNSESTPTQSPLPLVVGVVMVTLTFVGIFGYFI